MVGYSRLIGLDDIGTLTRLQVLSRMLLDPTIQQHGGRVVQTGGDSLLMVFDSIDGAVRCAIRMQQLVPTSDSHQPANRAIRFRVGINIEDVIVDGANLHGDGVNVAVRPQAECPPGGICVSRAVRDHVRGRLDIAFDELGPLSLRLPVTSAPGHSRTSRGRLNPLFCVGIPKASNPYRPRRSCCHIPPPG